MPRISAEMSASRRAKSFILKMLGVLVNDRSLSLKITG